jgi:hypothetical protein
MAEIKISYKGKEYIMLYDEEDFPIIEASGYMKINKDGYAITKLYTDKIKEISALIGKELKGNPRKNRIDGKELNIAIHKLILPVKDGMCVDHINGNKLDNRKENLREVTNQQNQWNRKIYKNNTTGYKGVTHRKDKDNYQARIKFGSKEKHLGYFDDPIEAARAYDRAALKYHGEFAWTNFPKEDYND